MEHIGYFRILPRELILELQKYFTGYFNDKSVIFLDTQVASGWQLTLADTYFDTYYSEIHIRSLVVGYNDTIIPFDVQYETLKVFLEKIINSHSFMFVNKNMMKLESVVPISNVKIDSSDMYRAEYRELVNKIKNFSVNIRYRRIDHVFYFALFDEDDGLVAEIYRCTLLQTEVLLYKLIQLYNGIMTMKLKHEY